MVFLAIVTNFVLTHLLVKAGSLFSKNGTILPVVVANRALTFACAVANVSSINAPLIKVIEE